MKIIINEGIQNDIIKLLEKKSWSEIRWGGGILPYCPKTKRFLLQQRAKNITSPNQWSVWGGKSDEGETIKECCKREFIEESGYKGRVSKMIRLTTNRKKDFTWYNFLGFIPKEFKPPMVNKKTVDGEIEVQDYKWVTIDELEDFTLGKMHTGLKFTIKKDLKKIKKHCNL